MPKIIKPLTEVQLKNATPKVKAYTLPDGKGLHLLIKPNGNTLWEFIYTSPITKKRRKTSMGSYPNVTLKQARKKREQFHEMLQNDIDPIEAKREKKQEQRIKEIKKQNTFKKVALERLEKEKGKISEEHYKRTINAFINDAFPIIGKLPIDEVEAKHIIELLKKMRDRKVIESAKKLSYAISKTFKYAVANGYASRNPIADIDINELLGKQEIKHYPTITDDTEIKNLITSIQEYKGALSTKYALLLLAYTAVRPSNARLAEWKEINFKDKQWVIPAKKMKTRQEHIILLSDQLIELLEDMKLFSGDSPYIFPSTKSKTTPLSDGALLGAIRRMGYTKEEFTPHGFRAMFSTIAHEKSKFSFDAIELHLAHSTGNSVSRAYNRAKHLDERRELVQWWADYLDEVMK